MKQVTLQLIGFDTVLFDSVRTGMQLESRGENRPDAAND